MKKLEMGLKELDPAKVVEKAMEFVKPIDEATERGDSDMQQFYRDAVVFITGGSGFIGKQLLEKLFRSCDIRKAFVLIRPKKGKSTKERLEDMLSDPVFEPVRRKKPDLESRIVTVEGDVANIQLGISNDDWIAITEEVDIIFHVAATVRFDEKLRTAAIINVRGTREALELGKACKKLRSFVHMSTAYSHATPDRIGSDVLEQFYKSPMPADTLLNFVDNVNEKMIDNVTKRLISEWPNTYTFTKAVAEELVQAESGNLPVCIVRPSIVWSTFREPVPGWLDQSCVYGALGVIYGGLLGFLRIFLVNRNMKTSYVPVDYVNNATIAAGWQTGVRGLQEPLIYNISSTRCGVTFGYLSDTMHSEKFRGYVPAAALWYLYAFETGNRLIYWFGTLFLHYIPAYVIDAVTTVFKIKKPKGLTSLVQIYKKLDKLSFTLSYFTTNEWNIDDTNVQNLWQKLSNTDRTIFNFEMSSVDWSHVIIMSGLGIRKYILKDNLKGTKVGVERQKWLKLANYAVLILYLAVMWMILSFCWRLIKLIY